MIMQTESLPSTGPTSPDSETCASAAPPTLRQSMLFVVDSPVSLTLSPVAALPPQTSATYGTSSPESFARYGPDGLWLKTSAGYSVQRLDGSLAEFSETWPRAGNDAEWDCLPASAFGAPHQRDRVWIVAYPNGDRQQERGECDGSAPAGGCVQRRRDAGGRRSYVADADLAGSQERLVFTGLPGEAGCDDYGENAPLGGWWAAEPNVGRVVDGVPARVDRLRGLGNAIVPPIAEFIARRILQAEERLAR